MENITVEDVKNVMDEPEQGCIVQAKDPNMLPAPLAFDGANEPSTLSSNNSLYWTSMLKLMEQGAAPTNTNNNIACGSAYLTPTQTPVLAATSSPSSSSIHDQPLDNMLASSNGIIANDPESLVWSQDILSGPIFDNKRNNLQHLACSDDGLHELLYPRTVLELLFSDDQLKLEQLPSWPDILQQTGKSFNDPDKIAAVPGTGSLLNVNSEISQLDTKTPPYLNNYSFLDDRLSSSTASSTLSDNTIDQWASPKAGVQCEHAQASRSATIMAHTSSLPSLQQNIDYPLVKLEDPHATPPSFTSIDQYSKMSGFQRTLASPAGNAMINEAVFNEYEQKPAIMNKHWCSSTFDPNDPLNHRHHIYESITAANFSHKHRLGALESASCFQNANASRGPVPGAESMDRSRASSGTAPAASLRVVNQSSQQIGKKSRPLEGADTGQVDEFTKKESLCGSAKLVLLDPKAKGAVHIISQGTNVSSPKHQQQQLSATEYNLKRPRIDQNPTSSSSFKNPPVRKEKLGERITTLQQLVSPFGKTDTASVLLEAIGYIKFLQEQVQALSSPYFRSPTPQNGEESKPDLRSRGLCLVPLSCTIQVANDNGADYWYGGAFR